MAVTEGAEEESQRFAPIISFDEDRCVTFLEMMYQLLQPPYQTQAINRLTFAYFVISALHILFALDRIDEIGVAYWVLSFQAHPTNKDKMNNGTDFNSQKDQFLTNMTGQFYGFHGSQTSQFPSDNYGTLGLGVQFWSPGKHILCPIHTEDHRL